MSYISYYPSPAGRIILASDGVSLTGLWFEGQKHFGSTLCGENEEKNLPVFEQAAAWLDIYFGGEIPAFTPSLKLHGTEFQLDVWKILVTIPYGRTVTYGEIAKKLAEQKGISRVSAQAAGGAVGKNPVSIIVPCHRVIGAHGKLTGYAGGIEKKEFLLNLEKNNKAV